jgi:hypothetical protein
VFVTLLGALLVLVLYVTYYICDEEERQSIKDIEHSLGPQFRIPVRDGFDEPGLFMPLLERSARIAGVNIVRVSYTYEMNNTPCISYYVLLTTGETKCFEAFTLREGRFLSQHETVDGVMYLSSEASNDPNQTGVLNDIGRNDLFTIHGLPYAFDRLPIAGVYTIETQEQNKADLFLSLLLQGYIDAGVDVSPDDIALFGTGEAEYGEVEQIGIMPWSLTTVWLAIVAVALMAAYRQLYETKRTAVLLLRGHNMLQAWYQITGRIVLLFMGCLIPVSVMASFLITDTTPRLITTNAVFALLTATFTLLASLVTLPYIATVSMQEALKDRKDTNALALFSLVVKTVVSLALVFFGTAATFRLEIAMKQKELAEGWLDTARYGVFYPVSFGFDDSEYFASWIPALMQEVFVLYPYLDARGALFVETDEYSVSQFDFEAQYPFTAPEYRSMRVNPNFLLEFPVLDSFGNPVTVSEEEADWVVLVPESLKGDAAGITEFFRVRRQGSDLMESAWEADIVHFGIEVTDEQLNQAISIIWVADNQSVFSFNSDVYPDDGNRILDPIIEVMTIANSSGFDRANCFAGGPNSALKVRLVNGSTTDTYNDIESLLIHTQLDDNLKRIVTMDEYHYERLQILQQWFMDCVFLMALALALCLVFII